MGQGRKKPVNISVSETSEPAAGLEHLSRNSSQGSRWCRNRFSKCWIGYTFPGGPEQTFVLKPKRSNQGSRATAYHFNGNLGHPVCTQDDEEDLYFVSITNKNIRINKVSESADGTPVVEQLADAKHGLEFIGYPPQAPQKDSTQKTLRVIEIRKTLCFKAGLFGSRMPSIATVAPQFNGTK